MERIVVTEAVLRLLAERRVFHGLSPPGRWRPGQVLGLARGALIEPYVQLMAGHILPARMGAFSYSHSGLDAHLSIGRYCSIAANVAWMGERHPLEWASTSPVNYGDPLQMTLAYFADAGAAQKTWRPPPQRLLVDIGHDVWIGDEAMIAPGVRIGHGAVIGARSLVLKDVPPYAIVGGNPAKVLRQRFPDAVVERMLVLEWWNYRPALLQRADISQPERFVGELSEIIAREGVPPMQPIPLTTAEIVAVVSEDRPAALDEHETVAPARVSGGDAAGARAGS